MQIGVLLNCIFNPYFTAINSRSQILMIFGYVVYKRTIKKIKNKTKWINLYLQKYDVVRFRTVSEIGG